MVVDTETISHPGTSNSTHHTDESYAIIELSVALPSGSLRVQSLVVTQNCHASAWSPSLTVTIFQCSKLVRYGVTPPVITIVINISVIPFEPSTSCID